MVMVKATAATYEWLHQEFTDDVGDTWLCVCFVQDVPPDEALRRIDVVPGSPLGGEGFGVAAYRAKGGTVLVEYGWGAIVHDSAGLLSEGSAAAAVCATIKGADFAFHQNGDLITTFSLYSYRYREGAEPDRLEADVTDLGLHVGGGEPGFVDDPTAAALALAERATGVRFSPAAYARTALVGSTEHLHPYV
ncbi:DUF6461 domain-containing protein [Nonomuraea sp. LP-02]|uniref:DUF6461 domain-containing protein n=1 Tax=Nonomuraea sp. LP-02 TaxID=3097960 RepID=UPI002E379A90|nr:DUF6461 domain-containing protein [Nonomuraea sp. LP-02]MED7929157.1 DUF6461 domain-containing protein [Nonomuraea sp. LP-02]